MSPNNRTKWRRGGGVNVLRYTPYKNVRKEIKKGLFKMTVAYKQATFDTQ
jgi:hypothetical protein